MSDSKHHKPSHSRLFTGTCLGVNIALSISIVLLNKAVYTHVHFPNMTLTFVHFVFTSVGMQLCRTAKLFVFKALPLKQMIPVSLTFCGFVVLTNLSLQSNTVGTYQIIKSLTTPVIIVIQTFFYSRTFSMPVKLTLVPICVGVFLNSHFDIKFNLLGIVFALSGVLVTSLYQVWVNEKQKELSCDAMQLLYYQAPLSAICVGIVIPFFEPVFAAGGIFGTSWSLPSVGLVSLTGVFAFAINLSIFWIIGNTSPVTYNMVGHAKFCLTLIGGYVLFQDPIQLVQFLGIFVTFSGIVAYTHIKLKEQKQSALKSAEVQVAKQESSVEEILKTDKVEV